MKIKYDYLKITKEQLEAGEFDRTGIMIDGITHKCNADTYDTVFEKIIEEREACWQLLGEFIEDGKRLIINSPTLNRPSKARSWDVALKVAQRPRLLTTMRRRASTQAMPIQFATHSRCSTTRMRRKSMDQRTSIKITD